MTKKEFEDIYRQHYAKMYRLARTMLYDADESKDVVSDIFARLLRDSNRPQKNQMEGYLMTAVRNRCREFDGGIRITVLDLDNTHYGNKK